MARTVSLRAALAAALVAFLLPHSRTAAAAGPSQASTLLGMTVVDARNKRLGAVADLQVDLEKGQILGLDVGHNTAEGMAHDLFPWSSVQLRSDNVVVTGKPIAQETPAEQSLAKILHAPLHDSAGKAAGEIDDLLVSLDDAKVAAFVIRFDPKWLDMAAPAAVPLTSLTRKDDGFVAKFSSEDVRPAGQKAPPTPPPPPPVHLARVTQVADSEAKVAAARPLLQARYVNTDGDVVGKVEDVVVDLDKGTPEFVVASFVGDWVAPGWLVVLPVRPVSPGKDGQPAMHITLNQINAAYLFEAKSWPDFSNPAVRAAIHARIDRM